MANPSPYLQIGPASGFGAAAKPDRLIGDHLIEMGVLDDDALTWALARQNGEDVPLGRILHRHGLVREEDLFRGLARQCGARYVSPGEWQALPALIDTLGVQLCLREGLLPIAHMGGAVLVATCQPQKFGAIRPRIEACFGPVLMAVTSETAQRGALVAMRGHALSLVAETSTDRSESCRGFGTRTALVMGVITVLALVIALIQMPHLIFGLLTTVALGLLAVNTLFLLVVIAIGLRPRAPPPDLAGPLQLPSISVIVPLHRERNIAADLVGRLTRLDYPSELLEVCLVTEADDIVTRAALSETSLPPWMTSLTVPRGSVMTKPRAMNYAMDFCHGSIVGVYDAEDAPARDQLRLVAARFAAEPPEVACLQGRLNFYNAKASWLSRCFAVEYATWFNLVLPALERLRLPIPLGGTTVFFRRNALEALGRWDAHNVTEDADLGLRLARHGLRTRIIDTQTLEEATCRPWPWIRQRSRWLKGYAVTYAVHMRQPIRLWRDLGRWGFLGVQFLFLGTLAGFLLAPLLWSFWLVLLGAPHPWSALINETAWGTPILGILIGSAVVQALAQGLALSRLNRLSLAGWLPAMHVYFLMASVAVLKALVETALCPFFWDKTSHGVSPPDTGGTVPEG